MRPSIALAALVLMAGCVPESNAPIGQTLPNCGYRGPGPDQSTRIEHPVTKEGGPFVGIATEYVGSEYINSQRFSLLNCKTRQLTQVETGVLHSSDMQTLFERIDILRREGRLTRTGQLERLSTENGWTYIEGSPRPENGRVKCACELVGL